MSDNQNLKIVVVAETGEAVKGLQLVDKAAQGLEKELLETSKQIKETESAFSSLGNVTGIAIGALAGVAGAFLSVKAIKAGAEISDINGSFEKLSEQAGISASVLKDKLGQATGETMRQVDLLKIANQGLQAGLKPEALEAAAKAARSYADAVGGDASKELDALIDGLAKGNDAFLKSRGILIDNKTAFEEYAKANGVAADKLTEVGKAEAIREAATTALIAKTKELGEVQNDTADSLDKVFAALSNTKDKILEAVGTNENLGKSFNEVAEIIKSVDAQSFIDNVVTPIVSGVGSSIKALTSLGDNLQLLSNYLKNPFDGLDAAFGQVQQGKRTEANKKFNSSLLEMRNRIDEADDIIKGIGVGIDFTQKDFNKFKNKVEEVKDAIVKSGKPLSDYDAAFKEIDRRVKSLSGLYSEELTPKINIASTAVEKVSKKKQQAAEDTAKLSALLKTLESDYGSFAGAVDQNGNVIGQEFTEMSKEAEKAAIKIQEQFTDRLTSAFSSLGNLLGGGKLRDAFKGLGSDLGSLLSESISTQLSTELSASLGASVAGPLGAVVGSFVGARVEDDIKKALDGDYKQLISDQLNLILPGSGFIAERFFGKDSAGTAAKKQADKYFADAFNANRLSVVINGQLTQLSDLVFGGNQEGGLFSKLPAAAQSAFSGIGTAFEGLLGIVGDLGVNIGNVFANNVGGSLNNLQLLVASTGVSFEELGKQVEQSFLKGELSALKAEEALIAIQTVAEDGIPGALGAVDEAFSNVFAAGANGGAALVDALKDVGYEANELGIKDLGGLKNKLQEFVASGKFTQEQLTQYFAALAKNGIGSIDQLKQATTAQLISIASALQQSGALEESSDLLQNLNNLPSEKTIKINVDTRLIGDKAAAEVLNNSGIRVGQQEGRS